MCELPRLRSCLVWSGERDNKGDTADKINTHVAMHVVIHVISEFLSKYHQTHTKELLVKIYIIIIEI